MWKEEREGGREGGRERERERERGGEGRGEGGRREFQSQGLVEKEGGVLRGWTHLPGNKALNGIGEHDHKSKGEAGDIGQHVIAVVVQEVTYVEQPLGG